MTIKQIYNDLGVSAEYISAIICDKENGAEGSISRDYSKFIADAIADDVARDIHECADHEDWDMDDVRLAVGRVLCKRLNIEV